MKGYFLSLLMALNQLVNTIAGGDPDMAVSARAGYARERGSKVGAAICHTLNWFDLRDAQAPEGDHCTLAMRNYENNKDR